MNDRDAMPTAEQLRKLHAEWTHDYGLRRLEDRGVRYEDQAERTLDHDADSDNSGEQDVPLARAIAHGQATKSARGRATKPAPQPPDRWPSEIAKANRLRPGDDHEKSDGKAHSQGRDEGHSI